MNESIKKRIKMIAFFATVGALSFTLMAKPLLKTVKAYLNPAISYTLDGEKVLEGVKTITYNNKTYVPLADVSRLMGLQTKFQNNTVIMTTTPALLTLTPTTTDGTYQVIPKSTETIINPKVEIKNAKILQVSNSEKYISIESKIVENEQLKLTFDQKTKIKYENAKKQPNINALKVGQIVDIKFENTAQGSEASTFKLLEITVKDK